MAKLLLNTDGKVLTSDDKVLKAPEGVNVMKTLLDGRKEARYLFSKYNGTSVDDLIKYGDTENVTSTQYMFASCTNLQAIPLLNTSNVTNMSNMFSSCQSLQTIPQLDTNKVTNMAEMFASCQSLQTIPQLDTNKVTNTYAMFQMCDNLKTNPQLNTSNVTNMGRMFYMCKNIETISELNTDNVTNMDNAFSYNYKLSILDITSMSKCTSTSATSGFASNCHTLTKLIIRTMTTIPTLNTNAFNNNYHFTGTVNSQYNPNGLKDGRIYVPDYKVEELKQATNWSAYADIIVPLSTLQEE